MWTRLTAEQKTKLSIFLKSALKGKLTIFASASVPDATDYAKEIAKVFADTGWEVPPVLTSLFVGGDITGTWITVRGPDVPPAAQIAFQALKAANIQIRDEAIPIVGVNPRCNGVDVLTPSSVNLIFSSGRLAALRAAAPRTVFYARKDPRIRQALPRSDDIRERPFHPSDRREPSH
jgi:hypothetical protein